MALLRREQKGSSPCTSAASLGLGRDTVERGQTVRFSPVLK